MESKKRPQEVDGLMCLRTNLIDACGRVEEVLAAGIGCCGGPGCVTPLYGIFS